MKFFIKRYSTLPNLEIDLEPISKKYNITSNHWESCVVTFSMYDKKNNIYKIANKSAEIITKDRIIDLGDSYNYYLRYNFEIKDTSKFGDYVGEFKVDFLGTHPIGKLTIPVDGNIDIIIKDSITRTDVTTNISILPNSEWYYGIIRKPGAIVDIPVIEDVDIYTGVVIRNQNPKNDIRLVYNSEPSDFIWFMIPSQYPIKTNWLVNQLNSGLIGGSKNKNGNLFPDPELFIFNNIGYNLYISNYRTKINEILITT